MASDASADPRYRVLVDTLDEGFVFQDEAGRVVFANPAASRILGLTLDQLRGGTSYDPAWNASFADGEINPARHPAVVARETGEPVTNVVMRVAHGDGREAWISVNARPVFDAGAERPSGVVVSFSDISEQVEGAAALRDERDHGRALVSALQDGLVETDSDGHITNVTDRFCEMTGFSRAELLGVGPPYPFWPERLVAIYSEALAANPDEGSWDVVLARRDGSTFPALMTASEIRDPDGGTRSLLGVVRDLTERNETEARFRLLAENSTDLITCHDAMLRCTYASPACRQIVGYEPEELIGEPLVAFWHPDDRPQLDMLARAALVDGAEVPTAEYRVRRKDGTYTWLESAVRVVRDEAGDVTEVQSRSRDVSARREAERSLRDAALERQQRDADAERHRLETELARAQRLESLGRLAGGIAHDFNNLLGVILNYASFVAKQLEPGSAVADDVVEIRRAAERAAELTRQLLLFGRREVARAETFEVAPVVEEVVALCRHSLGEVDLRIERPSGSPSIRADRGQLEQVLMNLLLNARDARATEIVVTVVGGSEQVALTVADDGDGMTPETVDQAFEPFFTTKSRDRGSGLGLASVHGIVTSAGGTVSIESTLGSGTRVTVELPSGAGAPVREPAHEPRVAPSDSAPTVLVVDDEPEVRVMTARILREHGLRVVEAHSAREALRLAKERSADFALLLTDVVMPSLSGVELAGIFRVLHPHVEVLLMSGYTDGAVDDTLEIPLLMKPFNEADLVLAVTRVLDRRETAPVS